MNELARSSGESPPSEPVAASGAALNRAVFSLTRLTHELRSKARPSSAIFRVAGLAWAVLACYRDCVGALKILFEQGLRAQGAALMGVLNVTPDSFFDGGRYAEPSEARAQVDRLLAEGADLIDIGGESTRPSAAPVPARQQIERIDAALRHALARGALVSVDTTEPEVAEFALGLGAHLINDVSCLANPDLAKLCARSGAALIIMHARGPMSRMPGFSEYPNEGYEDVVEDVAREWQAARARAVGAGMLATDVWFDPGLGFSKNARHSIALLSNLQRFAALGAPIVVGASRKSFIDQIDAAPASLRLGGSIAAALVAVAKGANVLRVHDVRETRQALRVQRALTGAPNASSGPADREADVQPPPLREPAHA